MPTIHAWLTDLAPGRIDLEDAEVACPLVGERVGLGLDLEPGSLELAFHFLDEVAVRQGEPGFGRERGWRLKDVLPSGRFPPRNGAACPSVRRGAPLAVPG